MTDELEPGLFVTDAQLHNELAPKLGKDAFAAAIKALEREGFPPKIALFRGRYFPAVKAWLDVKYGVRGNATGITAEDGPENFGATAGQKTGLQDRPARAALLDSQPGRARPDGFPRQVHPAPARR